MGRESAQGLEHLGGTRRHAGREHATPAHDAFAVEHEQRPLAVNTEGAGDLTLRVEVAQKRKAQLFATRFASEVEVAPDAVRLDAEQRRAARLRERQHIIERPQLRFARRVPFGRPERQDHRLTAQLAQRQTALIAARVRQRKIGCRRADLERGVRGL